MHLYVRMHIHMRMYMNVHMPILWGLSSDVGGLMYCPRAPAPRTIVACKALGNAPIGVLPSPAYTKHR